MIEKLKVAPCHLQSCAHLVKKSIKHVLADDTTALLLHMGVLERFNTDFPKIVRHSGNQRAVINERRYPIQQLMLFFDVVRLKHRTRKHELPAEAQGFEFDRIDVQGLRVID